MDLGLHDKHAIVTGGSRGIGKAIARELAREGVDVAIMARNKADLEATARELAAETNRMKTAGWGRIINISGGNARNAGNLSGGARNAGLVHMTKTLAVQLGRHGITANCIHPGTTRTERTPSLLATRAAQLGVPPEEAERRDFAPDSPRGNAICRMVDASEIAFVAAFLASEKAWAVSGELVVASGGAGRSVYY
jgi:NAD(P)-dependent dehydrogenase (short-subunit alcohol dehydrogenase family)